MHDVLDWLLPGASPDEAARVRRLITALRLLRDDARAARPRAESGATRAALELRRLERQRRIQTFEGLLHAWMTGLLSADSFLDLGAAPLPYEECLRHALDDPAARAWLPRPAESPREAIERLTRASPPLPGARELWNARRVHVLEGPERGEARWAEALRLARRGGASPALQAQLLAGRVAARLDRFDPRGAWDLFQGAEVLASLDRELCARLGWSALACGQGAAARELLEAAGPVGAGPPALKELRHALGLVSTAPVAAAPLAAGTPPDADLSRRALGAVVLGVFALRGERLDVLTLETAPAARSAVTTRLRERDGAWHRPGEPEHALVHGADPDVVRRDRGAEGVLRGALAGAGSRALALVPIRDEAGELRGWLHVESEHHLLPGRARLRALAATGAARERLLDERRALAPVEVRAPAAPRRAPLADDDPRAGFLAAVVAGAFRPGAHRRVHLVRRVEDGLEVLAELGDALEDWPAARGEGRAVLRALDGGRVTFHADPRDGLHLGARHGLVLPLAPGAAGARTAVVVESTRRSVGEDDVAVLEARRASWLPAWRAAAFRAWHRDEHGVDLAFDPCHRHPREALALALGAARVRTPLLVVGPAGSGRRVLARLVHFLAAESGATGAGLRVVDVDGLEPAAQGRLAAGLDEESVRTVVLATSADRGGRPIAALARKLDPLVLTVPRLCDRRDEIADLARTLAGERARRERLEPVRLEDEALAALWRQDWRGELLELDAVVGWLVRHHAGEVVEAADVRAALRARRVAYRSRLPSLRPRPGELLQALESTRHANGAPNRARAARYLGWDPDTLERRLRDTREA